MCVFCNGWMCVCVDFVMCSGVYVWVFNAWVCVCLGFVIVWWCVCVGFVMCGCVYVRVR